MKRAIPLLAGILLLASLGAPQSRQRPALENDEPERPIPGGKNMRDEIMKADHEKSIKDAAEMMKLSQELKEELEKNTRHILSIAAIKKTEEIEKLAKRIRSRMQR